MPDVYLCGSIPELGCWQVREAVRLEWVDEPSHWVAHVPLQCRNAKEVFEYKYFVSSPDDVRQGAVHSWETPGQNRQATVPGGDSPLVHADIWGQTTADSIMASPLIVLSPSNGEMLPFEYDEARNQIYEDYFKRSIRALPKQSRYLPTIF